MNTKLNSFKSVSADKNNLHYIVDRYDQEDDGEELRKTNMAEVLLDKLCDLFEDREDKLIDLANDIEEMAHDASFNAESALKLHGMNYLADKLLDIFIDKLEN